MVALSKMIPMRKMKDNLIVIKFDQKLGIDECD